MALVLHAMLSILTAKVASAPLNLQVIDLTLPVV